MVLESCRRAICAIGRAIAMPAANGLKHLVKIAQRSNAGKIGSQEHSSPFRDDRSAIANTVLPSPRGLRFLRNRNPALKRWAIVGRGSRLGPERNGDPAAAGP